jgi:hypothetical protein
MPVTRDEHLSESLFIKLMIGDHGIPCTVESETRVSVHQSGSNRNGVHDFSRIIGNRQIERFAAAVLPMHEIRTAGVTNIVVGPGIRVIPPDPAHMKSSIDAALRSVEVRIPHPLT